MPCAVLLRISYFECFRCIKTSDTCFSALWLVQFRVGLTWKQGYEHWWIVGEGGGNCVRTGGNWTVRCSNEWYRGIIHWGELPRLTRSQYKACSCLAGSNFQLDPWLWLWILNPEPTKLPSSQDRTLNIQCVNKFCSLPIWKLVHLLLESERHGKGVSAFLSHHVLCWSWCSIASFLVAIFRIWIFHTWFLILLRTSRISIESCFIYPPISNLQRRNLDKWLPKLHWNSNIDLLLFTGTRLH